VYSHADPQLSATGPSVFCQRPLSVDSRGLGVLCAPEGDEEGVALGVDLLPIVLRKGGPQQAMVVGARLGIALPELFEQTRRTFDVRKEKGDCAPRELRRNRVIGGRGSVGFGSRPRSLPMVGQKIARDCAQPLGEIVEAPAFILVGTLVRYLVYRTLPSRPRRDFEGLGVPIKRPRDAVCSQAVLDWRNMCLWARTGAGPR
jgi:hypothetical protein